MKLSYEGIGQYAATFACNGVFVGEMVRITENDTVGSCEAGENFCGQVLAIDKDRKTCTVALGGLVSVAIKDPIPLGWLKLGGDGDGGVQEDMDGHEYLVLSVDEATQTAIIAL